MPTSPPPIRLRDPLDLLGALPHLLGFVPSESLVLMCLDEDGRTVLTVRADLPSEADTTAYAAEIAGHAARAGAGAVALVVYTDDLASAYDAHTWTPPTPVIPITTITGTALPRRRLVAGLVRALDDAACPVGVALLVHRDAYANYLCADSCCPPGAPLPRTLTDAAAHVAAETVLEGRVVHVDRAALVARVAHSPHAQDSRSDDSGAADDVFERLDDELTSAWLADGLGRSRAATCGLLAWAVLRRLSSDDPATAAYAARWPRPRAGMAAWVDGDVLTPAGVARVAVGLHDKQARDLAATQGLDVAPMLLVDVLCEIARMTPDRFAAPVCTLAGWMAYLAGDGALANVALDRALACQPDHEMAHLLEHALRLQLAPSVIRDMLTDTRRELDTAASSAAGRARGGRGQRRAGGHGAAGVHGGAGGHAGAAGAGTAARRRPGPGPAGPTDLRSAGSA